MTCIKLEQYYDDSFSCFPSQINKKFQPDSAFLLHLITLLEVTYCRNFILTHTEENLVRDSTSMHTYKTANAPFMYIALCNGDGGPEVES